MSEAIFLAASFAVFLALLALLLLFSPLTRAIFFETVFHPFRNGVIVRTEDGAFRGMAAERDGPDVPDTDALKKQSTLGVR